MPKQVEISNWGNFPIIKANVHTPKNASDASEILKSSKSIIARGMGRCYGDAALNNEILSTLAFNQIISFDSENGIIECESGVTFSEILDLVQPKGFFFEVTPGTKFISVGGAIAANVHGKSHHSNGCMGDHVIELSLLAENQEIVTCSPTENAELFHQTIGGMGLTGIILSAKFKLHRITTAYIKYENKVANNIEELFNLFEEDHNNRYSVAWIDTLAKRNQKGRGIYFAGNHAQLEELPNADQSSPLKHNPKKGINIPFQLPSFTLNPLSIALFNKRYFKKNSKNLEGITTIEAFFYPLDSVKNWNRIYGKNGFIQYQFVLPMEQSLVGMKEIIDFLSSYKTPPFLTVLKKFGPASKTSPWSFPMSGYTLAVDVKHHKGIENLVAQLDQLVAKYKGRVYLAKDALSSSSVAKPIPFPNTKFSSIQSKRLSS